MSPLAAVAIFAAGLGAGTVNVIVGSGSLVTFPVLVALGYPPVLANVSNTVGLVAGGVSGTVAYRRELAGQRSRLVTLGMASLSGGVSGALLLLGLPGSVFRSVVPLLILGACALMGAQPRLSERLASHRGRRAHGGTPLLAGVFVIGVYGGYFGAAQGVMLIALLAILIDDDLQRLNATKNGLALLVNAVASIVFIAVSHVDWTVALLIATGSAVGSALGARLGRRLRAAVLRWVVVVVGTAVGLLLAITWH